MANSTFDFRGDPVGYVEWMEVNPVGFVLNVPTHRSFPDTILHVKSCHHIQPAADSSPAALRDRFFKVCAIRRGDLERWWASKRLSARLKECDTCLSGRYMS
jgi:hypothetical protein